MIVGFYAVIYKYLFQNLITWMFHDGLDLERGWTY
jgi:hypothetical protein